jgi:hypothetical protein
LQTASERFWIAGRYDGNRVIVYFDAVKFGDTFPTEAAKITNPVAEGFFIPRTLPESYIRERQIAFMVERFGLGDQYDLLLDNGFVATFRLTALACFHGDEFTGNDSYVGALGTLDDSNALLFQGNYFVVRPHQPVQDNTRLAPPLNASLLKANFLSPTVEEP